MKKLLFLFVLLTIGCKSDEKMEKQRKFFTSVDVKNILQDDSLSIRAIEIMGNNLAFAANKGIYGLYNSQTGQWKTNQQLNDSVAPEFRAVASTSSDFFMLSVGNPGLLYKTGETGKMELVYKEESDKVFYDSMIFWNEKEGVAMGDPTTECLSVIITRDGGQTWKKINCNAFPKSEEGEAAFAASNSNIAVQGDHTWILSGGKKSRIFYSEDKGNSWKVYETPLLQGEATTGGYSLDFYDAANGFIIGGDYTKPDGNEGNKARTKDGGKTWQLVGEGKDPGYKSSVRYIPNGDAKELVATGFTGISYSKDGGENWTQLSDEGFFTVRFLNDSTAYAAGKGRIAKLTFK
ncbi:WD40/YVTN/BNR-like repeat-containing protein [Gillisia sp. Hel_I_29]|uniref:WD40/YVTN/BNR-like repeat-containing protein n=1 Tax=Gillisia sp. Hel_I_29 TaxID=1249975 RepID=UPI00054D021A|nr:oxidoreductase [Gillisia sp. Hel_I_29]